MKTIQGLRLALCVCLAAIAVSPARGKKFIDNPAKNPTAGRKIIDPAKNPNAGRKWPWIKPVRRGGKKFIDPVPNPMAPGGKKFIDPVPNPMAPGREMVDWVALFKSLNTKAAVVRYTIILGATYSTLFFLSPRLLIGLFFDYSLVAESHAVRSVVNLGVRFLSFQTFLFVMGLFHMETELAMIASFLHTSIFGFIVVQLGESYMGSILVHRLFSAGICLLALAHIKFLLQPEIIDPAVNPNAGGNIL